MTSALYSAESQHTPHSDVVTNQEENAVTAAANAALIVSAADCAAAFWSSDAMFTSVVPRVADLDCRLWRVDRTMEVMPRDWKSALRLVRAVSDAWMSGVRVPVT